MVVNSHDTVLCFTDGGRVFWLTVYDIPQASRNAKGRPIVNVLNLREGERITAILTPSTEVRTSVPWSLTSITSSPSNTCSAPASLPLRSLHIMAITP